MNKEWKWRRSKGGDGVGSVFWIYSPEEYTRNNCAYTVFVYQQRTSKKYFAQQNGNVFADVLKAEIGPFDTLEEAKAVGLIAFNT